ncbi:MAG: SGNH/GDSL hydrolase family protein [Clostridia bacterium]|nr:SGNH/GDSL hydrolase family protein [Clostridia bacterium]
MENKFADKKFLFMGDSITALGMGERGWVRYFCEIINPGLVVNTAVVGCRWADNEKTVYNGNPIWSGEPGGDDNHNVIGNQIEKLLRGKDSTHPNYNRVPEYDDFDYIFIAAGTNDGDNSHEPEDIDAINKQFHISSDEVLPLEQVNRRRWAGAVRYAYENLRNMYPNAKIFICSPIQANEYFRDYKSTERKGRMLKAICNKISDVTFVNTFECGICGIFETYQKNGRDLIDGLHPNANGAKKMGLYNARVFLNNVF